MRETRRGYLLVKFGSCLHAKESWVFRTKKYQATKFAMKWIWKLDEQRGCLWSSFAIQIYSKSWYVTGPVILKKRGSFFGASPQTLEPMK
jgi:hypothetical protein